jgi:hypothetical protein
MADKIIFLLHIAATLFLTGLIWVIQLVQYPFFSYVGADNFIKYHDDYRFWITPVVAPAMVIELVTAALLFVYPPDGIDEIFLWLGLLLAGVVWASTFFLQVPFHEKLAGGFDPAAHAALVKTNWIRTVAWSLRGVLILYFMWNAVSLKS